MVAELWLKVNADMVAKRARKWSMKDYRRLVELAGSDSLEMIAIQMKRPAKTILKVAKRLGVSIRSKNTT
jgi:hypothetical protein